MMKRILSLLLFCMPVALMAQTDAKYLEGAVPVVDGKVTFTTEVKVESMSKEQIYNTLLDWANKRYQPDEKFNDRILLQDKEKGMIVVAGEEYMVFSTSALALDRTRIYYHFYITCEAGKCNLNLSRIRYWYDENRDGGEKYTAEEYIIDKWALNKAKTKLAPINGKFRRKTIDLKDELFKQIQIALGDQLLNPETQPEPAAPQPQVVVAAQPQPVAQPVQVIQPAQPVQPAQPATDQTPEALIAQAVRMTLTAGNDEQFEISKECWGGFGELFGKKVAFCLIDTQKTMGNLLMTQSESYTISFYTANSNQPAVVIRCKKLMTQNINGEEAQKMSPSCMVGKSYNMYVGEIIK